MFPITCSTCGVIIGFAEDAKAEILTLYCMDCAKMNNDDDQEE